MTAADRDRIRALAGDLPALWARIDDLRGGPAGGRPAARRPGRVDPPGRDRIDRRGRALAGRGRRADTSSASGCGGYQHLGRYAELRARVAALREQGESSTQIAAVLNREGFVMPRGEAFTEGTVRRLFRQFGVSDRRDGPEPGPDERWLPDLATALGVARSVVYRWQRSGYVSARRWGGGQSPWIIRADAAEMTPAAATAGVRADAPRRGGPGRTHDAHRGRRPGGQEGHQTSPDRRGGK